MTTNSTNTTSNATISLDTLNLFQALDAGQHALDKKAGTCDALGCIEFKWNKEENTLTLSSLNGHFFFQTVLPIHFISGESDSNEVIYMFNKKDIEAVIGLCKHKKGTIDLHFNSTGMTVKGLYEVSFVSIKDKMPDYKVFINVTMDDAQNKEAFNNFGFKPDMFTTLAKLTKHTKHGSLSFSKESLEKPFMYRGDTQGKIAVMVIASPLKINV